VALSRISPRVRVRVSVSIVYRIATGGYSWIWPRQFGVSAEVYPSDGAAMSWVRSVLGLKCLDI